MKGDVSMRFNFEECQLINNFFEEVNFNNLNKSTVIERLENARSYTEDPELINIAEDTINKLKDLDENSISKLLQSLPIDIDFIA